MACKSCGSVENEVNPLGERTCPECWFPVETARDRRRYRRLMGIMDMARVYAEVLDRYPLPMFTEPHRR